MSTNSISLALAANNSYKALSSNEQRLMINNSHEQAVDFQKMVEVQFNKFATMSPQQILNHVTNASNSAEFVSSVNNGIAESVIKEARSKVSKQEKIIKKSLVNEASLIDLVTVTTEARNTVEIMSVVRNKLLESWNSIINMQV